MLGFGAICCCIRQCIDHLACARVVQLFTGLMFNRVGIALQMIDVFVQALVLLLQLLRLELQHLRFSALVGERGQTVMAEDDAVGHHQRQRARRQGRGAATPKIGAVLCGLGERR